MDNLEDFLDGSKEPVEETQPKEVEAEAAPVTEEPIAETPEETDAEKAQRERDEKGRFKAKEEKVTPPPGFVPVAALQELREEIRALKAPAPQPEAEASPVPDIFEDPEGYSTHLQNQIGQIALDTRLNLSEELVRQSAGDEAVNAAQEWGKQQLTTNPAFAQAFYSNRNPYAFLVEQHKKATVYAKLGDDPSEIEAYLAWKQAKDAPPAPAPVPVPDTLADAQSARGSAADAYRVPTLDDILKR